MSAKPETLTRVSSQVAVFEEDFSYTYDDISLVPNQISEIEHRADCDTSVEFLGISLSVPVIASPMNTVCGGRMAMALAEMGTLGVMHRFNRSDVQVAEMKAYGLDNTSHKAAAIGINVESEPQRLKMLADFGVRIICIDVANGGSRILENFVNLVSGTLREYGIRTIMGNVASYETTRYLIDLGADAIRVGIGSGAMCSTSIKSGIGIGQVDAVIRALEARRDSGKDVKIIADGGISTPGAMCKAVALGCDAVMIGRALAGCDESPGEVLKYNNQRWKKYCGSASFAVKQENKNYVEGEESLVPYKGSATKVITEYKEGLQSSMSYLNSPKISVFQKNARFVKLSSSSFNERHPQFEPVI